MRNNAAVLVLLFLLFSITGNLLAVDLCADYPGVADHLPVMTGGEVLDSGWLARSGPQARFWLLYGYQERLYLFVSQERQNRATDSEQKADPTIWHGDCLIDLDAIID